MATAKTKQCRKCGQVKKWKQFTGNRRECKVCEAARKKRWEKTNRDHVNELHRKWAAANPVRAKNIKRRHYSTNLPSILSRAKERYSENRDSICAYARAYGRRNKAAMSARVKAWVKANPLRARVHWKNRRARKLRLPNTWTFTAAQNALTHWGNSCAACGGSFAGVSVHWDHWIPLIDPNCPGTVAGNMVPLCGSCNLTKNRRDALKWLIDRFGSLVGNQKYLLIVNYLKSV